MNTDAAQPHEKDAAPEKEQDVEIGKSEVASDAEQPGKGADMPFHIPKNPDELKKERSKFQSFEASGNYANYQVFVQNMNLEGPQQYKEVPVQEKDKKEARFDLKEPADCAEFVEEYKNGEYLALTIILAVFDIVSINDLPDMAEKLMDALPAVEEVDQNGNVVRSRSREPYLSLQCKLAVIGAGTFVRGDGQRCVGFGSKSKQVLRNIGEQFPALRVPIISWLIKVNDNYKYKTGFDAQQMIQAFSRVIALDFADAKREIFPRLYSRPENMLFLGTLASALLKDPSLKDDVLSITQAWAESGKWLWKSALFAYAKLDVPEACEKLKDLLQKNIATHMEGFSEADMFFLSLALSCSVHVRTMMCEILYQKLSSKTSKKVEKDEAAGFYLTLVTYCYYYVDEGSLELPLVVCDTKEQQQLLAPALAQVLSSRDSRRWLFDLLELYLKEISGYSVPARLVRHTAAYFSNMMRSAPVYQEDVSALLRKCSCGMTQEIFKLLGI